MLDKKEYSIGNEMKKNAKYNKIKQFCANAT